MAEEGKESTLKNNPVRELLTYVNEFPKSREVDSKFAERQQFWISQMEAVREAEEKREITAEEADFLRGSMITTKEWLSSHDSLTNLYNRR